jgi:hypothetical protein
LQFRQISAISPIGCHLEGNFVWCRQVSLIKKALKEKGQPHKGSKQQLAAALMALLESLEQVGAAKIEKIEINTSSP